MKKIAIITARSGSKGLPNKNVLLSFGKPLIAYSIEAAIESGEFEKIIVSTDSQEYIDLLSHYPIEFVKRDAHLASDKASSFVVIEDVLKKYADVEFDYFVLLQPTSPLRTAQHIREANAKFEQRFEQFDFLVSVTNAYKSTTLTRQIDEDESLKHFQLDYSNYARQQTYPEYSPNGAIFTAKPQPYLEQKHFFGAKSLSYFMDKNDSIDIDDRADYDHFIAILQQRHRMELLLETIKRTIQMKRIEFSQTKPITFIGHSILEHWHIDKLNGKAVNNLGIGGIRARQYLDLILNTNKITELGETAILMFGTNDINDPNWTNESILNDIQNVINRIKQISPNTTLYFLEIIPVALRVDRRNEDIRALNTVLKAKLTDVKWIELDSYFSDKYQKLNIDYTTDGLHLNQKGYEVLTQLVEKELQ